MRIGMQLVGMGLAFFLLGIFFVLPLLLTLGNAIWCFLCFPEGRVKKLRVAAEILTLVLGMVYSLCFALVSDIDFQADWWEQLYNSMLHTPLATWTLPTVLTLGGAAVFGYLLLRLWPLEKMPPLVAALSIGAMYIGIFLAVLWCIQLTGSASRGLDTWHVLLGLFPFNCILLAVERLHILVVQWRRIRQEERKEYRSLFLQFCNQQICAWGSLPLAGLVLMVPLLGILILILTLFGQSPDAAIEAFTQTSDWRLSLKEAPPNLVYDEHYLCTVAAGGHPKVVKPLRKGLRHGHPVIVNRQLCIANAFEQILEERTPRFHRAVRNFYDTYGFPIAKGIRSPFAADVVYFLMKPLEWIFLIVIYFCDAKPENRIAVQYLK